MYYLVFSNNSENIFLSIYQNTNLILQKIYPQTKSTSEDVFNFLQDLFSSLTISITNISFVGLTNGPSSFTNSRILVSLANAIALSLNIPTISFSNFYFYLQLVISSNISFQDIAITIDSKRKNGLYICLFSKNDYNDKKGFFCNKDDLLNIISNKKNIIFYGDKPVISNDKLFYDNFNYIDSIVQNNDVLAKLCYQKYQIIKSNNQHNQPIFSDVYYI